MIDWYRLMMRWVLINVIGIVHFQPQQHIAPRPADLTELKQQIQPILGSVDQVKAVYRVTTMEPYSTLQFKESFPTSEAGGYSVHFIFDLIHTRLKA